MGSKPEEYEIIIEVDPDLEKAILESALRVINVPAKTLKRIRAKALCACTPGYTPQQKGKKRLK